MSKISSKYLAWVVHNREKCNWPFKGPRMPQGDKNWDTLGVKMWSVNFKIPSWIDFKHALDQVYGPFRVVNENSGGKIKFAFLNFLRQFWLTQIIGEGKFSRHNFISNNSKTKNESWGWIFYYDLTSIYQHFSNKTVEKVFLEPCRAECHKWSPEILDQNLRLSRSLKKNYFSFPSSRRTEFFKPLTSQWTGNLRESHYGHIGGHIGND